MIWPDCWLAGSPPLPLPPGVAVYKRFPRVINEGAANLANVRLFVAMEGGRRFFMHKMVINQFPSVLGEN